MRGTPITSTNDRPLACSNCQAMSFLQFAEMNPVGATGLHFCATEYREAGAFEPQPWDHTCNDFKDRVLAHDKNKCLVRAEIPCVPAPVGWTP